MIPMIVKINSAISNEFSSDLEKSCKTKSEPAVVARAMVSR